MFQTDRHTDKQTQTERQTDKEKDRQIQTDRQTESDTCVIVSSSSCVRSFLTSTGFTDRQTDTDTDRQTDMVPV